MRFRKLGVAVLLAACVAGCGGNSTPVGVVVAPATATVLINNSQQFSATGTGSTTTTVNWQVCLPPVTSGNQPTRCSPLPGQSGTGPTGIGTITTTGRYTAPATVPETNPILVLATSTVSSTSFATASVTIDSGVRVTIDPTSASISTLESVTFTATVTGTTNKAVTWSVNGVAGGNAETGFITANGTYTAPATQPGTITVTATSAADPTKSASAGVGVDTGTDPVLTSIDPTTAGQGSVQQDVYLNGKGFFSTSTVLVDGVPIVPTFINNVLLRVTIPSALLQQAKLVKIQVQRINGDLSGISTLNVTPVRPAVIASTPDSVSQTTASVNIGLTGGFFFKAPAGNTTAFFNGLGPAQGVSTTFLSSRQLLIGVPPAQVAVPGLYPIVVQNPGIAAGLPSLSAVNLAATPNPTNIPTAPIVASIGVGAGASALAIDPVLNLAAVANTGDGSVSVISLDTNTVVKTIANVGNKPTGITIDDQLHKALVVNSGDNTVSTVDMVTQTVVGTPLSVQIGATQPPVAIAIGLNSLTHRAIVAYQSSNLATVLDLSLGTPVIVSQIGGTLTPYSTGAAPEIAIDPRLNWAVVTPGGAGSINIVDLGTAATAGNGGRPPQVIGNLSITTSMQGVGINGETHQVLLSDPNGATLQTFSLLNQSVNPINFPVGQLGFVAAGVSSLTNVGISVNVNNSSATIVDMENGIVLQTVSGLGASPQAVAVDSALSEALVVNQGSATVSVVSLGDSIRQLQIAEASPALAFAPATAPLTLTINGRGFVQGTSQVVLDGAALPAGSVTVSNGGRQIVATVPASMLASARRYIVTVQNSATNVSNATDLTVIQPVIVGNSPSSVAVDTDRDVAVVTNTDDGTISLIDLTTGQTLPQSPLSVGSNPAGVAVLPRLGLAVVANNGSNNISIIDENGINSPQTIPTCAGCSGPNGVAVNQDTAAAVVANSGPDISCSTVSSGCRVISIALSTTASTAGLTATVNQNPTSVAIDPTLNYAGIGTASQAGSLDIVNLATTAIAGRINGIQIPSGVVFDPVNQVFVVTNSLQNNLIFVDPNTFIATTARVGINPTSLDYNFQTSTLVTVNSASNTMSFLDYVCPSTSGPALTCPAPQTRAILGLPSSSQFSQLQQFSVAVDPKMSLSVVVDQNNSRVLLIPLPH